MLAISLTSIPPRFAQLGPTLESLLGQRADAVFLCLPRHYRRFGPAQGFAGVAVSPDALDAAVFDVPDAAFAVDDIWLSGHFARLGLPIRPCAATRALCTPRDLRLGLQADAVLGRSRAEANRACVRLLDERYGIWPDA